MDKSIVCIIPAKSHSERIPHKNTKLLAGKRLLDYTIDAALESKCFSEIIVSTEEISLSCPKTVKVWIRPKHLAEPLATVTSVVRNVLSQYNSLAHNFTYPESFAVLLPTSPLRTSQDISAACQKFTESNAKCLMSVSEYDYPPQWALELDYDNKYLGRWTWNEYEYPLTVLGYGKKYEKNGDIRQKLKPLYKHNGSIIIAKTESFLKASDWLDMKTIPWQTPVGEEIDIDNQEQWDYAEYLLRGK